MLCIANSRTLLVVFGSRPLHLADQKSFLSDGAEPQTGSWSSGFLSRGIGEASASQYAEGPATPELVLDGSVQVDAAGQFWPHLRRKGAANPRADGSVTSGPGADRSVAWSIQITPAEPRRCAHRAAATLQEDEAQGRIVSIRAIGRCGSSTGVKSPEVASNHILDSAKSAEAHKMRRI
jgi:hypothetical protein